MQPLIINLFTVRTVSFEISILICVIVTYESERFEAGRSLRVAFMSESWKQETLTSHMSNIRGKWLNLRIVVIRKFSFDAEGDCISPDGVKLLDVVKRTLSHYPTHYILANARVDLSNEYNCT